MQMWRVAVLITLVLAGPVVGKSRTDAQIVDEAAQAVGSDPAKALALVEPVIAASGIMTPKPETDYVCADGGADTLMKLMDKAVARKNAIAIPSSVCSALFIKGFVLIDLNRRTEAEPFLRRATELDPTNVHYLNEYAEWWKSQRQWIKAYELFSRAALMTADQPPEGRAAIHARSLRGMGYTLIELGRLDEAERKFDESLRLEPGSRAALSELQYIKEQRARAAGKPAS